MVDRDKGFRITVEDLETDESAVYVVAPGDYCFLAMDPCYVASKNLYRNGTVQVTIKNHSPKWEAKRER